MLLLNKNKKRDEKALFNDIDKKLKYSWILTFIISGGLLYFTAKMFIIVTEWTYKGEVAKSVNAHTLNRVCMGIFVFFVLVSVLSLLEYLQITYKKVPFFEKFKKSANKVRTAAWIVLILGFGGTFCFCFWSFFYITSRNAVLTFITYAVISVLPCAALAYSLALCVYGFANASDGGGDAKYVKNSALFGVETLHGEDDDRKRCPFCGTRTNRHSCPNCGAKID